MIFLRNQIMNDIPRSQSIRINKTFSSDVPEIDLAHLWVRLPKIQNLIQCGPKYFSVEKFRDLVSARPPPTVKLGPIPILPLRGTTRTKN